MKKLISILLSLVILVSLAACGAQEEANEAPVADTTAVENPAAEVKDDAITIGFTCNNATGDANQAAHFQSVIDNCEAVGVEVVALDPAGDANVQFSQIENFIEMGVDGILFRAVDSTTIIPALKKAKEAGIPVVCTTNIIDESGQQYIDAFSGPSDYNQAVEVCKVVKEMFADQETVNILQVQHVPGTTVSQYRDQGFWDEAAGSNLVLLEKQTANGKREEAQQITENWLLKYDVAEIDAIFVEGDGMLHGVTAAMEAAGLSGDDIKVFGVALSAETYDKIASGLVAGSCLQSPYDDAALAVETLVKLINGETEDIEFLNYVPNPAVTKETLNEVERPDW